MDRFDNNIACYSEGMHMMSMIGEGFLQNKTFTTTSKLGKYHVLSDYLIKGDDSGNAGSEVILSFLPHLLVIIVAIVVVSRILHFSLRYFKQPLIVCQLISGILIFSFLPKPKNGISTGKNNENILISPSIRRMEYIIGSIGILFNLFLAGVKLDYSIVWQFKKKEPFIIGFASLFFPLAVGSSIYALQHKYLQRFFVGKKNEFLLYMLHPLCTTYPITQSDIFAEMGILNSDLGRLALSSSMTQCVIGWVFIITFTVLRHANVEMIMGVKVFLSFLGLFTLIMIVIQPYARWIVHNTPPNTHVRDKHIFVIMVAVIVIALISDSIGFTYADGPIIMGLTLPQGAPLGTALIERVEMVASEIFLPIVFMNEGFYIDWAGLKQKLGFVMRIQLIVLITFITKIAANTAAAMYCERPFKEGVLLGLMMNFRGLIDMLVFLSMTSVELIDKATFTALVLPTIAVTAICVPFVSIYYKPLGGKRKTGHRTVQHVSSHAELRVMTCFFDSKHVPDILEFLESASSPQTYNPLCIYALHLVELQACYTSSLISHRNKRGYIDPVQMDNVHNHFINFGQTKKDGITILPFTSMTPLKTMHQDVCSLIVERNIAFVVIPYPRKNSVADIEAVVAMRGLVPLVLEQAQCSVGILVYHGTGRIMDPGCWKYNVGVLFWGGPDDREVIAIASCMARHPGVYLNILCFNLTSGKSENQQIKDQEVPYKQNDDKVLIEEFRAANAANINVSFSDITVRNLEKASSLIHALGDKYDLLFVGRRQECSLMQGKDLEQWIESPELGMTGDMLANDVSCVANVLVVQQHKL